MVNYFKWQINENFAAYITNEQNSSSGLTPFVYDVSNNKRYYESTTEEGAPNETTIKAIVSNITDKGLYSRALEKLQTIVTSKTGTEFYFKYVDNYFNVNEETCYKMSNDMPFTIDVKAHNSTNATAEITESVIGSQRVFNIDFGIPKGVQGDKGADGRDGVDGKDGSNPTLMDLTNSNDTIGVGSDKILDVPMTLKTKIMFYYNGVDVSTQNNFSWYIETSETSITYQSDGTKNGIIFTCPIGTSFVNNSRKEFKIKGRYTLQDGIIERECLYTIIGLANGEDGVSFSLKPSADKIIYNPNDGKKSVSSVVLTCRAMSGMREMTSEECIIKMQIDNEGEVIYNRITESELQSVNKGVTYILRDITGTIELDREWVPVISEGKDGKDSIGLALDLTNNMDGVGVGSDYILDNDVEVETFAYMFSGATNVDPSGYTLELYHKKNDGSGDEERVDVSPSTAPISATLTPSTYNGINGYKAVIKLRGDAKIDFNDNYHYHEFRFKTTYEGINFATLYKILGTKNGEDGSVFKINVYAISGDTGHTEVGINYIKIDQKGEKSFDTLYCKAYNNTTEIITSGSSPYELYFTPDKSYNIWNKDIGEHPYQSNIGVKLTDCHSSVTFYLVYSETTNENETIKIILDRETIPFVRDGADGIGFLNADLTDEIASVSIGNNKKLDNTRDFTTSAYLPTDTKKLSLSAITIEYLTNNTTYTTGIQKEINEFPIGPKVGDEQKVIITAKLSGVTNTFYNITFKLKSGIEFKDEENLTQLFKITLYSNEISDSLQRTCTYKIIGIPSGKDGEVFTLDGFREEGSSDTPVDYVIVKKDGSKEFSTIGCKAFSNGEIINKNNREIHQEYTDFKLYYTAKDTYEKYEEGIFEEVTYNGVEISDINSSLTFYLVYSSTTINNIIIARDKIPFFPEVKDGETPKLFEIIPDRSTIEKCYSEGGSEYYTPNIIKFYLYTISGSTRSQLTSVPEGYTLTYLVDNSGETSYTPGSELTVGTMKPQNDIQVILKKDNLIYAKCGVSVYKNGKDGTKGTSTYKLDLSNENASIIANHNGTIPSSSIRPKCTAKLSYGSEEPEAKYSILSATCIYQGLTINENTGDLNFDDENFSFEKETIAIEVGAEEKNNPGTIVAKATMNVTKVKNGVDGTPATSYWLTFNANSVKVDKSGNVIPKIITATCYKQVGANPQEEPKADDAYIVYEYNTEPSSTSSQYVSGITIDKTKENISFSVFSKKTWTKVAGPETIPILKDGTDGTNGVDGKDGKDGTSPFKLDLSNDNASVIANADGTIPNSSVKPYCKATLYQGTESWTDLCAYKISSASTTYSGISINSGTGVFDFTSMQFTGDTISIKVSAYTKKGSIETIYASASMNITKVKNGVAYWLSFDNHSIKEKDGTMTPNKLNVKVFKQEGNNTPDEVSYNQSNPNNPLKVFYKYDGVPQTAVMSEFPVTGLTLESGHTYLSVGLYSGYTTTILDGIETIPILKDGVDGERGPQGATGADGKDGTNGTRTIYAKPYDETPITETTDYWTTVTSFTGVTNASSFTIGDIIQVKGSYSDKGNTSLLFIAKITNISGKTITIDPSSISIISSGVNGVDGPSVVSRGEYSSGETYYGSSVRTDVVHYVNVDLGINKYYKTRSDAGEFRGVTPTETSKWLEFGQTFENVATNLLLANETLIKNAYVDKLKTLGTQGRTLLIKENYIKLYGDGDGTIVESGNSGYERVLIDANDVSEIAPYINETINSSGITINTSDEDYNYRIISSASTNGYIIEIPNSSSTVDFEILSAITCHAAFDMSQGAGEPSLTSAKLYCEVIISGDSNNCRITVKDNTAGASSTRDGYFPLISGTTTTKEDFINKDMLDKKYVEYTFNPQGKTITLSKGNYKIFGNIYFEYKGKDTEHKMISYPNTSSTYTYNSHYITPIIYTVKDNTPTKTHLGANGMTLQLTKGFYLSFTQSGDNGGPEILLSGVQGGKCIGLRINGTNGVQCNNGNGWRNITTS